MTTTLLLLVGVVIIFVVFALYVDYLWWDAFKETDLERAQRLVDERMEAIKENIKLQSKLPPYYEKS